MSSVPGSSHLWPASWWSSCGLLEISRRDGKVQKRSDIGSAPAERSAPLFALGAPPCVTREGVAKVIYAGYNVSGWGEFILYISERINHDIQIKKYHNNKKKCAHILTLRFITYIGCIYFKPLNQIFLIGLFNEPFNESFNERKKRHTASFFR